MNDDALLVPDFSTALQPVADLVDRARDYVIASDDDYRQIVEFVQGVKALRQQIAATYDPHVRRLFEAHRALCAERTRADEAAATAERIAKTKIVEWDTRREQERAREQARLAAAVAEATLAAAVEVEQAGDPALAAAILDATPTAAVPGRPRVEGVRFSEKWTARVHDFAALVAHVAAHPDLLGLLKVDQRALDQQASSLRSRMALPGVTAVPSRNVAVGTR